MTPVALGRGHAPQTACDAATVRSYRAEGVRLRHTPPVGASFEVVPKGSHAVAVWMPGLGLTEGWACPRQHQSASDALSCDADRWVKEATTVWRRERLQLPAR
jgi:hypothetical protein